LGVNGDIAVELDRELTARFDAEMEQIYFRAKHEVKYNATYFLRYGFAELLLAGRPDLTMEALVLRPEFSPLFTPKELTTAAERLRMRER
jgi:hypothetical protein